MNILPKSGGEKTLIELDPPPPTERGEPQDLQSLKSIAFAKARILNFERAWNAKAQYGGQ